jgi:mono/diheme cytochrome c family protein
MFFRKIVFLLLGIGLLIAMTALSLFEPYTVDKQSSLAKTLEMLGDKPLPHQPDMSIKGVSREKGADLVLKGITSSPQNKKTNKQSNHFVCTSCHNIQREDPDLRISDPQTRLLYARDNNLSFLPGTTLYGAVNRTSFYNGDYEKKYGDLVRPARYDLREAIQLCAVECAQGRKLEAWEVESILAYLWSIDLKLEDLQLSSDEYDELNAALNGEGNRELMVENLKARFLAGAPATFVTPPDDRKDGYNYDGDPQNGKLVYDLSCKHCHENQRYAFFNLDDSKYSFKHMEKHISRYTRYSIYQVIRWGTSPIPGKRAYMPNYTLEKLSHQQVEDLRAYIELEAQ